MEVSELVYVLPKDLGDLDSMRGIERRSIELLNARDEKFQDKLMCAPTALLSGQHHTGLVGFERQKSWSKGLHPKYDDTIEVFDGLSGAEIHVKLPEGAQVAGFMSTVVDWQATRTMWRCGRQTACSRTARGRSSAARCTARTWCCWRRRRSNSTLELWCTDIIYNTGFVTLFLLCLYRTCRNKYNRFCEPSGSRQRIKSSGGACLLGTGGETSSVAPHATFFLQTRGVSNHIVYKYIDLCTPAFVTSCTDISISASASALSPASACFWAFYE